MNFENRSTFPKVIRSEVVCSFFKDKLYFRNYLGATVPLMGIVQNCFARGGSRNFHLGRPVKGPSKCWVGQQEWCTWGRISFG